MSNFDSLLEKSQIAWRRQHVSNQDPGTHSGIPRDWILPNSSWQEGLWSGIRASLPAYLEREGIKRHEGVNNLKSSWVLCANLYFPFRNPSGRSLLARFLREQVSEEILDVTGVELEYAEKPPLDPQSLLGEPDDGKRGAHQTSPDVAFIVTTTRGPGLILTESKLAEHSFYRCSGRKTKANNPDPARCLDWTSLIADPSRQCWQMNWANSKRRNRRYWEHIKLNEHGRIFFRRCPAASAGYQLFRQQALAEAIANSRKYALVVSSVAYDARNATLLHSLRRTGIDNFATDWGALFAGGAKFVTWTHQEWVSWVRTHDAKEQWHDWLSYMESRYGYGDAHSPKE